MSNQDNLYNWWWSEEGPQETGPFSVNQLEEKLNLAKERGVVSGKESPTLSYQGWNYAVLRFLWQYCDHKEGTDSKFWQDLKDNKNSSSDTANYGIWKQHGDAVVNIKKPESVDRESELLEEEYSDERKGKYSSTNEEYEKARSEGRVDFITFHPSYSYEEFIEGITVSSEKEGIPCDAIQYVLKPGIFKNICKRALANAIGMEIDKNTTWYDVYKTYTEIIRIQNPKDIFKYASKFVLIIDEINRGDIAKIFGELITLLEADKRLGDENELKVVLPTSRDEFGVPPNVYIIATMNTADRSIALIDIALRRRFGFVEMMPRFDILKSTYIEPNKDKFGEVLYNLLNISVEAVELINDRIYEDPTIGTDRQIGHSFFYKVEKPQDLIMTWRYEILPLLQEYCYGDYTKINNLLFDSPDKNKWISEKTGIKEIENIDELKILIDEINASK